MKAWLQHSALSAVVLAFLPLIELASPAVSRAQPPPPPCAPGMYWNFATVRCEFPLPPPVYIDPWLPVYVPDIIDADLDLDVDIPIPGPPGIGAPGPPGGIGPGGPNIGRPDQDPDLAVGVVVGVAVGDARSRTGRPNSARPSNGSRRRDTIAIRLNSRRGLPPGCWFPICSSAWC